MQNQELNHIWMLKMEEEEENMLYTEEYEYNIEVGPSN